MFSATNHNINKAKPKEAASNRNTCIGIDWLCTVYCLVQEYFTHAATSPLSIKAYKISALARRLRPPNMEGCLSCHTCYDTGPRLLRSHPKGLHILGAFYDKQRLQITYSNRITTDLICLFFVKHV